ncbi:3'-5' exonuclease [Shewanella schlegeliana]|uniref:3'-5' exonuclease n=1 Tax=Shewanella schlegeliana TaxID=190308 RepID=A0ABS1SWZ4_9GAMM|nr:exonuclease domain-containing protein [Shewanella schlegeliana]MBL4913065.1 3'-5' exonuclease [Shewanella schlegeliana]MCL1111079.1 3'-5' exonuclease [Shewanella schlegeliana]
MRNLYLKTRLQLNALFCKEAVISDYNRALVAQISKPLSQLPLMAVDLEMTGLDCQFDQILSIGLIPIHNGLLQVAKSQQLLVSIDGSVGDSAAIHGILDNQLTQAVSAKQAMAWFLEQTKGHVLVAHHAPLDLCFLKTEIQRCYGQTIQFVAIDTMAVEKRRLLRQHDVIKEGTLRLDACRQRYGLPVYAAHNAAVDALACGELLLAQMAGIAGNDELSLFDLLG